MLENLTDKVDKLEVAQTRQEIKIDAISADLQDTKNILIRFENEYQLDRGGIFDGLDVLKDKTTRIEDKVDKLENRVNNHELHILALEHG